MPAVAMESRKKNVAKKIYIPAQTRQAIAQAWADERKEKISSHTYAFRLSLSATYFFGALGLAGYFNLLNESAGAYSPLFFNVSLFSGTLAGYHYTARKEVIKKKYMSDQEIEQAYINMQMAKKMHMNQV